MSIKKNKELREIIQYHISNKMILNIKRVFGNETDVIRGFPIKMSEELLIMTVINDFHDEGFAILRLSDISDAYSEKNDIFYEKICITENIGLGTSTFIKDVSNFSFVLKQLINYKGFCSIQCENQIDKCTFYLGKISAVEHDGVFFKDVGLDGRWDDEMHKISFDKITQITFADNYSKMYYKYVEKN